MIKRNIEDAALKIWSQYPVLTITGPRQSGKTTLARTLFSKCEYVNLEAPDVRAEIQADARGFLSRHPAPVIFDEIQNTPELVSYIQELVDANGKSSLYVLTGSLQPSLQAAVSQSLAGRTGLLELLPLSIAELKGAGFPVSRDELILKGFMPRLYNSRIEATQLYSDYFRTYVERDVRQMANLRNMGRFETFIRLLSGRIGQLLNIESLAGDAGVSASTIYDWLSLLEASYIIFTLRPYYRNFGKRFIKAPKIYFTETGLAAYLLGIRTKDQVATHPLVGNLFENMVVAEMLKNRFNRGFDPDLYFIRTSHGVEADIVLEQNGRLDLYEVKAGSTFHDEMAGNLVKLKNMFPDEIGKMAVVYAGRASSSSAGVPFMNFDQIGENRID